MTDIDPRWLPAGPPSPAARDRLLSRVLGTDQDQATDDTPPDPDQLVRDLAAVPFYDRRDAALAKVFGSGQPRRPEPPRMPDGRIIPDARQGVRGTFPTPPPPVTPAFFMGELFKDVDAARRSVFTHPRTWDEISRDFANQYAAEGRRP